MVAAAALAPAFLAANAARGNAKRNVSESSSSSSSSSESEAKPRPKRRLAFVRRANGNTTVERWPPAAAKPKTFLQPYPYHGYVPPPPGHFSARTAEDEGRFLAQGVPPPAAAMRDALSQPPPPPLPQSRSKRSKPVASRPRAIEKKITKRKRSSASSSEEEVVTKEDKFAAPVHGSGRWDGKKIHYCYRCGRWRSKSFHHQNVNLIGDKPLVGVCSRCKERDPPYNIWGKCSGKYAGDPWFVLPPRHRTKSQRVVSFEDDRRPRRKAQKSKDDRPRPRVVELSSSRSSYSSSHRSSQEDVIEERKVVKKGGHTVKENEEVKKSKRSSSEDITVAKDPNAEPPLKAERPYRIIRIIDRRTHRRSSSSPEQREVHLCPEDNYEERLLRRKLAQEERRREIDRRVASHPNAWARGRIVPVARSRSPGPLTTHRGSPPPPSYSRQSTAPTVFPPSPPLTPERRRSPSPPEWEWRHVVRRAVPECKRELYRKYDVPPLPPSKQPPEPRDFYERSRQHPGNPYSREPSLNPKLREHRFRYVQPRHSNSGDSSDVQRVRFAPGTKDKNNRQPADGPIQNPAVEAHRDNKQEHRDEKEIEGRKDHVRRKLHKGAGPFELDGCASEASLRSDMYDEANNTTDECEHHPRVVELSDSEDEYLFSTACQSNRPRPCSYPRTDISWGSCDVPSSHNVPYRHLAASTAPPIFLSSECQGLIVHRDLREASDRISHFCTTSRSARDAMDHPEAIKDHRDYRHGLDGNNQDSYPFPSTSASSRTPRSQSSSRSSPFTTPSASLFQDDPIKPSRFPRAPHITPRSIFDNSWDNRFLAKPPARKLRRFSSASSLPSRPTHIAPDTRPAVIKRNATDPRDRRSSLVDPPRSARVRDFQEYLERESRQPSRPQSLDRKTQYHESLHAYHEDRRNSDTRPIISRQVTPSLQARRVHGDLKVQMPPPPSNKTFGHLRHGKNRTRSPLVPPSGVEKMARSPRSSPSPRSSSESTPLVSQLPMTPQSEQTSPLATHIRRTSGLQTVSESVEDTERNAAGFDEETRSPVSPTFVDHDRKRPRKHSSLRSEETPSQTWNYSSRSHGITLQDPPQAMDTSALASSMMDSTTAQLRQQVAFDMSYHRRVSASVADSRGGTSVGSWQADAGSLVSEMQGEQSTSPSSVSSLSFQNGKARGKGKGRVLAHQEET